MTVNIPFVDLKTQYQALADEIGAAVTSVMKRSDFILGEDVSLFEKEFAAFCGVRHAIGVASGTDALYLSLMACGVGPGDEVITVANTFIATVLAISFVGAKPVLVDIDPTTYNMDVGKVSAAITSKTKAIMPVHLYGQAVDMDAVLQVAKAKGLKVVEDACQAHGTIYKLKAAGAMGEVGCFSFYPGKNLGAYGDGGMAVTNSDELANRLRMLRNYGQRVKYYHDFKGLNSRLDTIQAAILRVKLKRLATWNDMRRRHALSYNRALQGAEVVTPAEASYGKHIYHLYVVRSKKRDELKKHLESRGVSVGIHYPVPIHLQSAYRDLGYPQGSFPVTEQYAQEILSLPMFPELTDEQIAFVSQAIKEFAH
ncbi:MAG: DegT/DnrJ/EryC1/StrS family aminotransferase [Planctomycetes bacterium]|nr:DegT/DnrJ/EryC1/StrS family aminotransferase [Planctomycetota bacterium]